MNGVDSPPVSASEAARKLSYCTTLLCSPCCSAVCSYSFMQHLCWWPLPVLCSPLTYSYTCHVFGFTWISNWNVPRKCRTEWGVSDVVYAFLKHTHQLQFCDLNEQVSASWINWSCHSINKLICLTGCSAVHFNCVLSERTLWFDLHCLVAGLNYTETVALYTLLCLFYFQKLSVILYMKNKI